MSTKVGSVWLTHLLRSDPKRPPQRSLNVDVLVQDILNQSSARSAWIRSTQISWSCSYCMAATTQIFRGLLDVNTLQRVVKVNILERCIGHAISVIVWRHCVHESHVLGYYDKTELEATIPDPIDRPTEKTISRSWT
jgi:hypothetical protein